MSRFLLLCVSLLCVACATSAPKMDHYLLQDTRTAFEEGMQKNYAKCAPVAFAEAEAHLVMAHHEFSEGNMDRDDAQALKEKADAFLVQAKKDCTPKVVIKPKKVVKVAKVIKKVVKKKPVKKQKTLGESVYFKSGKFKLSQLGEQKIVSLLQTIVDKKGVKVVVSGHADEQGDAAMNQRLSCLRANEVTLFLIKTGGINAKGIQNQCHGESLPSSQGHDEKSWQKNRRVDLRISTNSDLLKAPIQK